MKREHSAKWEAADDRLEKMRLTKGAKGVKFKHKENEKQHNFNEENHDKIESVTKTLSATPPAVEKVKS